MPIKSPDTISAEFTVRYVQCLNNKSELIGTLPEFATPETLLELYRLMSLTRAMDTKAVNLQRTGQMSTYPSSRGQEAYSTALGHALYEDDILVPYYRDQGALIQRKMDMSKIYQFWGGDERGNLHEGHDFPMSVPIATQFLHAAGAAFAVKHQQQNKCVVSTGGDGSTSKGDFYEALNLAGVWNLPLVFVINNNQWAISVPANLQTKSQTIAQKAIAAGFDGIQVDGNDVIATRDVIRQAIDKSRNDGGPTLIEAINYRLCDHTTADDASRYQPDAEITAAWQQEPIARLAYYLEKQGLWSKAQEQQLQQDINQKITEAVNTYLNTPPAEPSSLFDNLYATLPEALIDQYDRLKEQAS